MEEKESQLEQQPNPEAVQGQSPEQGVAHSRRRLFRQGAAVVAVTLVSRPVLACHCRAPSAWGSEQISPHKSMQANDAYYEDNVWTIQNWKDNSSGVTGLGSPWGYLENALKPANKYSSFNYKTVKVSDLVNKLGFTNPGVFNPGSTTVVSVLADYSSWQSCMLVLQLNYFVSVSKQRIVRCTPREADFGPMVRQMLSGSYSPAALNVTWGKAEIMDYLHENYIVRRF